MPNVCAFQVYLQLIDEKETYNTEQFEPIFKLKIKRKTTKI